MKNYLTFVGGKYYLSRGWEDFKESFDTREEAKKFVEKLVTGEYEWGQVIFIGDDIGEELVTEFYYPDRHFNYETKEWYGPIWTDSTD